MLDLQIQDPNCLVLEILSNHFPNETLGGVRLVGSGACNVVYGTRVGDKEVVVRLANRLHRAGEHAKEAWCIQKATAVDVIAPFVFGTGEIGDIAYMIQDFVRGQRGDAASADPALIWQRLGEYARQINGIEARDFIEGDALRPDWRERKWARYVEYGIESLIPSDRLIELGVYTPSEQAAIRSVFQRLGLQTFSFGLFHGDLSLVNTIVGDFGNVALIDWGCAEVGIVPHAELSAILGSMNANDAHFGQFLCGYGMTRSAFSALYPEICDFRLLQAFDLVRWSIDRRPEALGEYVTRAMNTWAEYKRLRLAD